MLKLLVLIKSFQIYQHHPSDLQMGGSLLESAAHDLFEVEQASNPQSAR